MEFLKAIPRSDPFWKALKEVCKKSLDPFCESDAGIDADYDRFKTLLVEAVREANQVVKPMPSELIAKLKATTQFVEMRKRKNRLFRAVKAELDQARRKELQQEAKVVSRKLKRLVRKEVERFKKERVREIEDLKREDCRFMWKALKDLSGWTSRDTVSSTVLDEAKKEVEARECTECGASRSVCSALRT